MFTSVEDVWVCSLVYSKEMTRGVNVTFNNTVRRVFNCKKWESVKDIAHGFSMVPINVCVIRTRLLMIGVALFERRIVCKCARRLV